MQVVFVFVACLVAACTEEIVVGPFTFLPDEPPSPRADAEPPSRELNLTGLDHLVNTEEGRAEMDAEFQSILGGKRKPWTEGEKPDNLAKNRYDDLLAFDETRVHLPYENGSDYINANYVNGYHGEREYIATQGPLPNTTGDFWAMIWDQRADRIVMLANLVEHGKSKVSKYWPDSVGAYGGVFVHRIAEIPFPRLQHVMRVFILSKPGNPDVRVVRQFHFTGWPDLGVPDDRKSVIALMAQVRKYPGAGKAPIVIHCSAGVGRTGTVLLMDSMAESAKDKGVVDFPKRLDSMRLQRVDAVEKKEQYLFAHQAVLDILTNDGEMVEYMKEAEAEYREADFSSFLQLLRAPGDMADALRQLKWHSAGLQQIVAAMENGFK